MPATYPRSHSSESAARVGFEPATQQVAPGVRLALLPAARLVSPSLTQHDLWEDQRQTRWASNAYPVGHSAVEQSTAPTVFGQMGDGRELARLIDRSRPVRASTASILWSGVVTSGYSERESRAGMLASVPQLPIRRYFRPRFGIVVVPQSTDLDSGVSWRLVRAMAGMATTHDR